MTRAIAGACCRIAVVSLSHISECQFKPGVEVRAPKLAPEHLEFAAPVVAFCRHVGTVCLPSGVGPSTSSWLDKGGKARDRWPGWAFGPGLPRKLQ